MTNPPNQTLSPRQQALHEAALHDRMRGCLLGLMCGDALGAPVERKDRAELHRRFPEGLPGLISGWGNTARVAVGDVTDDSEMAICLLESLCRCRGYRAEDARRNYVRWLNTEPPTVGRTTAAALRGEAQPDSQANGALMRIAPLAIYSCLDAGLDWSRAAAQDAAITHVHPRCAHANIIFTEALRLALSGAGTEAIHRRALARAEELGDSALKQRLLDARHSLPALEPRSGWVEIAFQAAFRLLLLCREAPDVAPALCRLAAEGGDPDTNAAIAGALLGARFGTAALPEDWQQSVLRGSTTRPADLRPARALECLNEAIRQSGAPQGGACA